MGLVVRADIGAAADECESTLEPVSSIPVWREASIMRLRRDASVAGGYVFDREVPLRWFGVVRRNLEHAGKTYGWWRLEAKVNAHELDIRIDDCLVCAEEPYSTFWAAWGFFRGPNRRGSAQLPLQPFDSEEAAATWVSAAGNDYWESDKFLTAAFLMDGFGISGHENAGTVRRSARFTLGACPAVPDAHNAFDAAFESLWRSEEVGKLLNQTHRRTIPVAFRGVNAPKLSEEVADQAEHVMLLAIRQALAGPAADSEKFFGQPVLTLVSRIYRNHLNNLNRQEQLDTIARDPREFE